MIWAQGTIVQGHRVASGYGNDPRFPGGTIRPQLPALRASIPDFDQYLGGSAFAGTINVRLDGVRRVVPGEPDFRIGPVPWTDVFPPEIFLISRAMLRIRGQEQPAFLYIPDPATKPGHYQPSDVIELLAGFLLGLTYGDPVELGYAPQALHAVFEQ
jgi:hypothetical protein